MYDFYIVESHALAFCEAVGIKAEHFCLRGSKLDGLPDGIVDDVRELARGQLRPV